MALKRSSVRVRYAPPFILLVFPGKIICTWGLSGLRSIQLHHDLLTQASEYFFTLFSLIIKTC